VSLIFVSYSRKDIKFAKKLAADLKRRGVPVWLDVLAIPPGERWDEVVENALEDSSHLLLVVSASSNRSRNVRAEWHYALEEDKHVIPLILEDTKPPLLIRPLQRVDFHTQPYADALHELLQALPHSTPAAAAEDVRLRFWETLLEQLREANTRHAGLKPHNRNVLVASAGTAGFKLAYVIRQHGTGVALIIDQGSKEATKAAFDALIAQRAAIDAAFGKPLAWHRQDDHKTSRVDAPLYQGGYLDDDWDTIQTALIDAMAALEGALEGRLETP
jgi:hypothetical protein